MPHSHPLTHCLVTGKNKALHIHDLIQTFKLKHNDENGFKKIIQEKKSRLCEKLHIFYAHNYL